MREGMRGKAGIGKVALYGREYLVAIKAQQHGLVMYTLHHAAEIRRSTRSRSSRIVPRTVKPQELKLAKQVVDMFEGELNLKDYKDEYKEELREDHRRARWPARKSSRTEVEEPPSNVVDLMAALSKSLDAASSAKKQQRRPNCRQEDWRRRRSRKKRA